VSGGNKKKKKMPQIPDPHFFDLFIFISGIAGDEMNLNFEVQKKEEKKKKNKIK